MIEVNWHVDKDMLYVDFVRYNEDDIGYEDDQEEVKLDFPVEHLLYGVFELGESPATGNRRLTALLNKIANNYKK